MTAENNARVEGSSVTHLSPVFVPFFRRSVQGQFIIEVPLFSFTRLALEILFGLEIGFVWGLLLHERCS